jgi:hypothetical protein
MGCCAIGGVYVELVEWSADGMKTRSLDSVEGLFSKSFVAPFDRMPRKNRVSVLNSPIVCSRVFHSDLTDVIRIT